jgi:hypothetical protein
MYNRVFKDDYISSKWYKSLYSDVRESKIDSKDHYRLYGKNESRFPNLKAFLNHGALEEKKITNLIIKILFYQILFFQNRFSKKVIFKIILFLEKRKLKKFSNCPIIITSWLDDGVKFATDLYASKQSQNKTIVVLRGLKHLGSESYQPMLVEFWTSGKIVGKTSLLFPIDVIYSWRTDMKIEINVHLHHIFEIESFIEEFCRRINPKIIFYIHDYSLFTSNFHLLSSSGSKRFLLNQHLNFPNSIINLKKIKRFISLYVCPSVHSFDQCLSILPRKSLHCAYHPEQSEIENIEPLTPRQKSVNNVLILGNLGPNKGSAIIENFIRFCAIGNRPFHFMHIGNGKINGLGKNYSYLGYISRKDIYSKILSLDVSLAFIPFTAEETYSFTLSDIFLLRLPLVSTKIGAIPERTLGRQKTVLLRKNPTNQEILAAFYRILSSKGSLNKISIPSKYLELRKRLTGDYFFLD